MKTKFKETEIGTIHEDWEVKIVGDLVKINECTINKNYNAADIEYIDTSSVDKGHLVETQKLKLKEAPSRAKRILKDNDILISTVRPNLKHFFFVEKSKNNLVGSTGFIVISSKKINPKFLYYYLTTNKYTDFLSSIADAHTSTYPSFNPNVIENSFCPYPKEDEQKFIANILSDLDSKIELNRQMNKTLEIIGQAIFKRWFIDFEFPNEKGKPYKLSGGEMVDSELGKIPNGWKMGRVGEFVKLERGLSYNGKGLSDSGIPMVNLGTIFHKRNFVYEGLKYYSGEYKERNLVKSGDLVIANTDITQDRVVLGSPSIIPPDLGSEKILFTHHIYAIRNSSPISNLFFFYLLKTAEYKGRVRGFATGTTVLALPEDTVLDLCFSIPVENVLKKFNTIVNKIKDKMFINIIENRGLSQIHASLLPRLMSGKIRVSVEVKA